MNKVTYHIVSALILLMAVCSCSSEENEERETEGLHSCRLIWNESISGYGDGSRAAMREKRDGDCVYLQFKSGSDYVDGKAVYNKSAEEWILTYNGSLSTGQSSSCVAYFIDKTPDGNPQLIELTPQILVCCDEDAEYIKGSNYVKLSAYLTPVTGRIRFKGETGQKFLLSGIKYFSDFNTKTLETRTDQTPLQLTVGNNGFTDYVHALPLAERTLTVYYDYQTYRTNCDSPILDAGRSGYMLLPTESVHNGWSLVKVEQATLSAVTTGVISDMMAEVKASVTSLGNGTLLDAGFVYSETTEPTLESNKISCGAVTTLNTNIHNLKPVTTYYVRAYATNERGISYSQQLQFTTTATPTVPKVSTGMVSDITSNRATVSATLSALGEVSEVTQHGHVWSRTTNPTMADFKTELGKTSSVGDYSSTLTGLLPNTKYFVRAYAVNSVGTSYGEEQTFTTPYGSVKIKTSVSELLYNATTIKTVVSELGGYSVAEQGICWSATSSAPSVSDNVVKSGDTSNTYTCTITNLTEKTSYYVCSYVRTTNGNTFYSDVLQFTTPAKDEQFKKEDFGEDENWGEGDGVSDSDINKGEFGDEEDWNN